MRKKVIEKFQTRLNNFLNNQDGFTLSDNKILFSDHKVFSFEVINDDLVILKYTKTGVSPNNIDPLYDIDYELEIYLDHKNLIFLSNNLHTPLKLIPRIFGHLKNDKDISKIVFGGDENKIENRTCYIANRFYKDFKVIYSEESKDRNQRIKTRVAPFFDQYFDIQFESELLERDYDVLLDEIISSESLTDKSIMNMIEKLEPGIRAEVVIKERIEKQARWLIDILREIVDTEKLNQKIARELG